MSVVESRIVRGYLDQLRFVCKTHLQTLLSGTEEGQSYLAAFKRQQMLFDEINIVHTLMRPVKKRFKVRTSTLEPHFKIQNQKVKEYVQQTKLVSLKSPIEVPLKPELQFQKYIPSPQPEKQQTSTTINP